MSGPPPLTEEQKEELLAKKRAFAEKNGEADNACQNVLCRCTECSCGAGCTCNVSPDVTCDPCKDFKAKMASKADNAARAKAAAEFWDSMLKDRWEGPDGVPHITASEVLQRQKEVPGSVLLVDCRPESEIEVSVLPGSITTADFEKDPKGLSQDKVVVVYCTLGGRSAPVAQRYLKAQPNLDVKNLKLSLVDWCHAGGELVDPAGQPTKKVACPGGATSSVPGMFPSEVEIVNVE